MRIRATVAAVSGALALSAFAIPGAHAADASAASRADVAKVQEAARAASGKAAFSTSSAADTGTPYTLDLSFSNVKVNNGKPIVAGISNKVTAPVTFTVTHGADVDITAADTYIDLEIYRGTYDEPENVLFGDDFPSCTATSTTVASCKGTIDVYPDTDLVNADAATWKAIGYAVAWNGVNPDSDDIDWSKVGYVDQDALATTKLQRYSKLTVNAGPEPVTKGKTLTATGKLTRANWETHSYKGYTNQPVKLQFRKAGTSTYTTIKTVTSDSYGNVKATTTASTDGYWRFRFEGTSTTPAVSATGDYVDVK
ncbi:hypothetical protein [Streptomyces sp. R35]|uniref:Calcium-binding protein n=1 Tax=Streptomyces sp. R35 TaxID=3238630 RepID=A0AB39S574_9ACTN